MAKPWEQYQKTEAPKPWEQYQAPPEVEQEVDFDIGTAVSNVPASGMKMLEDIYTAVTNPVQTGNAIKDLAVGTANKAGRNAAELVTGQELEEMPERSEAAPDAMGQMIVDRYGSVDKFQQTVMDDPVGAFADMAGVLTGVGQVANVAKRTAGAAVPKNLPAKMYENTFKPSTKMTPAERSDMIKFALDEGVLPTAKGVEKVTDRIQVLGSSIGSLIDEATDLGIDIPANIVLQNLSDLRKTKGGFKYGAADDMAMIDDATKTLKEMIGDRKTVTPRELQDFKIDLDRRIKYDRKSGAPSPTNEDIMRNVADSARSGVAQVSPEVAEINAKLSKYYNLEKPLIQAAGRVENRNLIGIDPLLKSTAGGAVGGGPGAIAGGIVGVLGHPKIKSQIAVILNKLEKGADPRSLSPAETAIIAAITARDSSQQEQ